MRLVALSFYLAFSLRFLDEAGIPHRYEILFAQAVGFVVVGKLVVFAAFGMYQKWWRYVSGRDFLLIARAVTVASAILSSPSPSSSPSSTTCRARLR